MKLTGSGSAKILDFCSHGHVFINKTKIPPALFTERINELGFSDIPEVVAAVRDSQPLNEISKHKTGGKAINGSKPKAKRRLSDKIVAPKPCDILFHHCCINEVFSLRGLLQYLWCLKETEREHFEYDIFSFFSGGTMRTNTDYVDNVWEQGLVVVCICGSKDEIQQIEEHEIEYEEYIQLLRSKLEEISSAEDKILNDVFPGLHIPSNNNNNNNAIDVDEELYEYDCIVDELETKKTVQEIYGCCGKPEGGKEMVACDICEEWKHCDCVGYKDGDSFICNVCEQKQNKENVEPTFDASSPTYKRRRINDNGKSKRNNNKRKSKRKRRSKR